MSLRLRIVLTYALLVGLSFSCVIWLIVRDVRPRYLEAVEDSMVDTAEFVAALLSQQAAVSGLRASDSPAANPPALERLEETMNALAQRRFKADIYNIVKREVTLDIYITDAKGVLLYDSSGRGRPGEDFSLWNDVLLTLRGGYGARSTRTDPDDPSTSVLYVAAPILQGGELCGVVSVNKPTNSVSFLIGIAQRRFFLGLLLVGLTAIALAAGLSCWITRPVRRLTAYADAVRRGEDIRPPDLGRSEIGDLGRALEEMQVALAGKNYIEDYVRALTHELKSPLTGIKGAGEILRERITDARALKFLDNIDSDAERLASLVERMLQLSRLENVRSVNKSRFLAREFLEALVGSFQTRLAARGLNLELDAPEGLAVEGDALLLSQAVGNLVANALDFSPVGASVRLTARAEGGRLILAVRDRGAGIPEFAQEKVFDKFFSLSRPGGGNKSTGLGLPFVREVMILHGGEIILENKDPGLLARLELPLK